MPRPRRLVPLLVALLCLALYAGFALNHPRERPAPRPEVGVAALDRAVLAARGTLESAMLVVNEPVSDPDLAGRVAARLGWGATPAAGEERTVAMGEELGGPVLRLNWRLTGSAAAGWAERYAALRAALAAEGVWPPIQVELAGRSAEPGGPLELAHGSLDGVAAASRQPWSDERSASVAGWSPLLPPGPYEVNVQVAVRRQAGGSRFWIGWPAVRSDY